MTTWTESKRIATLDNRGLDFADVSLVFKGRTVTAVDDRFAYGETRFLTAGYLGDRLVVIVWTQRGEARHIISMRHCHAKEEKLWVAQMG